MDKEQDDIEFEELLADKRHKEINAALKGIALALNNPNIVADAITKSTEVTKGLADAIKKMPDKTDALQKICDKIVASNKEILDALKNKPMVDSFKIKTMDFGEKTINVIYKPANQIIIEKY